MHLPLGQHSDDDELLAVLTHRMFAFIGNVTTETHVSGCCSISVASVCCDIRHIRDRTHHVVEKTMSPVTEAFVFSHRYRHCARSDNMTTIISNAARYRC